MNKPKALKEGQVVFRVQVPPTSKRSNIRQSSSPTVHSYICSGCSRRFARKSDLTRHLKSHTEPKYQCPYYKISPTCHKNGGAFHRLDVYKRHLKLVHFIRDVHKQNSLLTTGLDMGTNLSGWCGSCQKLFPNAKSFIDHVDGCEKLI